MSIDLTGVTASRTSGVAPLAVRFDAHAATSTSVSNPFHFIDFSWNFGDPAGSWSYGSTLCQDKNTMAGPIAAHVFETPGSYTVTLTAFDGVLTATKTFSITVTDPATVFATTGTVLVDPSGAFSGSASYPGATTSTLSNLDTIITTYPGKRILLARGQIFNATNTTTFGAGPGILGAFGTGAKPTIRPTALIVSNVQVQVTSDWRIMDLTIDCASNQAGNVFFAPATTSTNVLVLRINSASYAGLMAYTNNTTDSTCSNVFIVDCDFQGCVGPSATPVAGNADYLIWCQGIDGLCVLGTRLYDSTKGQHICRLQWVRYSVVANCYMAKPLPSPSKGVLVFHGPDFVTDNGGGKINQFNSIYNCFLDTGLDGTASNCCPLSINPSSNSFNEHIEDIIADSCFLRCDPNAIYTETIGLHAVRVTIRNNITKYLNVASDNIGIATDNDNAGPGSPPTDSIWILNNVWYHATTTQGSYIMQSFETAAAQVPTNVYIYNNLRYCATTGPSFDGAGGTFTPTAATNNSGDTGISGTAVNPLWVNGSGALSTWTDFELQSGSYAVIAGTTSATDIAARKDAARVNFLSPRSIGPFQYGSATAHHGGGKSVRYGF